MNTKPHLNFNIHRRRAANFMKEIGWVEPTRGWPPVVSASDYLALMLQRSIYSINVNTKTTYRQLKMADFVRLPTYQNFLMQGKRLQPLIDACLKYLGDQCSSYNMVADSAPLPIIKYIRVQRQKQPTIVEASFGYSIMIGKYYGFKMHLGINHKQEIINHKLTPANTYDGHVAPDLKTPVTKYFMGDNHYSYKALRSAFKKQGCTIIAPKRKNQKDQRQVKNFKIRYRKRQLIETVFSVLIETFFMITFRPRSFAGFVFHYTKALLHYQYRKLYG